MNVPKPKARKILVSPTPEMDADLESLKGEVPRATYARQALAEKLARDRRAAELLAADGAGR